MTLIHTRTEGNITLEHRRFRDDFGVLRDSFELIELMADGTRRHYPFVAHFKVKEEPLDEVDVLDATQEYDDADYALMMREQPGRIGVHR